MQMSKSLYLFPVRPTGLIDGDLIGSTLLGDTGSSALMAFLSTESFRLLAAMLFLKIRRDKFRFEFSKICDTI